jgi:hypothetical protein
MGSALGSSWLISPGRSRASLKGCGRAWAEANQWRSIGSLLRRGCLAGRVVRRMRALRFIARIPRCYAYDAPSPPAAARPLLSPSARWITTSRRSCEGSTCERAARRARRPCASDSPPSRPPRRPAPSSRPGSGADGHQRTHMAIRSTLQRVAGDGPMPRERHSRSSDEAGAAIEADEAVGHHSGPRGRPAAPRGETPSLVLLPGGLDRGGR